MKCSFVHLLAYLENMVLLAGKDVTEIGMKKEATRQMDQPIFWIQTLAISMTKEENAGMEGNSKNLVDDIDVTLNFR